MELCALTNALPAIVWACNANGDTIYLNDRWYQYTGHTSAESWGTGWITVLHPDDRARIIRYWKHCCATGETYEGECRYRRYDGEYRWHEFRAIPCHDSTGHIDVWYGVSVDITERKKLDDLFRDNWEQLRLGWQATGDILWDWDVEKDSVRLSSIGNEMYEWLEKNGVPQSLGSLFNHIHPEDLPRIKHSVRNVMLDRTQTHWINECRIVRPDGKKRIPVLFRGLVCRSTSGVARRIVGSLQDLTLFTTARLK
jgi:PAS domain S-box-containing protein